MSQRNRDMEKKRDKRGQGKPENSQGSTSAVISQSWFSHHNCKQIKRA